MMPALSSSWVDDPMSIAERKGLLELAWLMTAIVVFLGVAVPWFFHALDVDLRSVAWALAGFAAVYVAASRLADNLDSARSIRMAAAGLHIAGIVTLAGVWHLAGGLQNPAFLILFALPVVASCLTAQRALPYVSAALAVFVAGLVALAESPGLRWYLERLGVPFARSLGGLAGTLSPVNGASDVMPVSPTVFFVTLVVFALSLASVAFVAESLSALLLGLYGRLATSRAAREDVELLHNKLLQGAPDPSVLLASDSGRIVQASDSFARDLLLDREEVVDRELLDVVEFSYPDVIRQVISGGVIPFIAYRVSGEVRVGSVHAWQVRHADTDYSYFVLRDATDVYHLHAALDSVDEPYLLIGADGRLVYFNAAAAELFGELHTGLLAERVLSRGASPRAWWDIGLRATHDRKVEIRGRPFEASLSASPVPGEQERLTVIRLRALSEAR